jgi:hypothetical protein
MATKVTRKHLSVKFISALPVLFSFENKGFTGQASKRINLCFNNMQSYDKATIKL